MPDNTPETSKRLAQRIRSDLDSASAFPLGPDERRFTHEDETIAFEPVICEDRTISFVPVTREDETIAFGPVKAAELVDIGMDLVDAIEIAGFSGIAARLARNCEEALKELALYDDDKSLLHITTVHHLIGEYLQRIADELDGNAPEPIQQEPAIGAGKAMQALAAANADSPVRPVHSDDFTTVDWFGTRYTFTPGNQAEAVRYLWEMYEKGKLTASEKTIGDKIGSASDKYRLIHTFRDHLAWGTMIQRVQNGVYRLAEPESQKNRITE